MEGTRRPNLTYITCSTSASSARPPASDVASQRRVKACSAAEGVVAMHAAHKWRAGPSGDAIAAAAAGARPCALVSAPWRMSKRTKGSALNCRVTVSACRSYRLSPADRGSGSALSTVSAALYGGTSGPCLATLDTPHHACASSAAAPRSSRLASPAVCSRSRCCSRVRLRVGVRARSRLGAKGRVRVRVKVSHP